MSVRSGRYPGGPAKRSRSTRGRDYGRIFSLIRELGEHGITIDDEARRQMAAQFRQDGKATMKDMAPVELARLEAFLAARLNAERRSLRAVDDAHRQDCLRRHKRIAGDAGDYAATEALYNLRKHAQIVWGADWEAELHKLIKRTTGYDLFWDSLKFPRDLHHQCTEGVMAIERRAARDVSAHGKNAEINARGLELGGVVAGRKR